VGAAGAPSPPVLATAAKVDADPVATIELHFESLLANELLLLPLVPGQGLNAGVAGAVSPAAHSMSGVALQFRKPKGEVELSRKAVQLFLLLRHVVHALDGWRRDAQLLPLCGAQVLAREGDVVRTDGCEALPCTRPSGGVGGGGAETRQTQSKSLVDSYLPAAFSSGDGAAERRGSGGGGMGAMFGMAAEQVTFGDARDRGGGGGGGGASPSPGLVVVLDPVLLLVVEPVPASIEPVQKAIKANKLVDRRPVTVNPGGAPKAAAAPPPAAAAASPGAKVGGEEGSGSNSGTPPSPPPRKMPSYAIARTVAPLHHVDTSVDRNDSRVLHLTAKSHLPVGGARRGAVDNPGGRGGGARDTVAPSIWHLALRFESPRACLLAKQYVER
jgi:hypothetical protein